MADEPSNGELGRLIQALREDIREDIGQLNGRLDRMVSADVYAVEKAAAARESADLKAAVEGLRQQRELDTQRVTQTRRWMIASVIVPLLGILLPMYVAMKGAGG